MTVLHRLRHLLCLLGLVSLNTGCADDARPPDPFIAALGAAAQSLAAPPATLSIASLTRFEWDQLWILRPYTAPDSLRALPAEAVKAVAATRIAERDDIHVFVFLHKGGMVKVLSLPRPLDFKLPETPVALTHGSARFTKSSQPGTLELQP